MENTREVLNGPPKISLQLASGLRTGSSGVPAISRQTSSVPTLWVLLSFPRRPLCSGRTSDGTARKPQRRCLGAVEGSSLADGRRTILRRRHNRDLTQMGEIVTFYRHDVSAQASVLKSHDGDVGLGSDFEASGLSVMLWFGGSNGLDGCRRARTARRASCDG